MKLGLLISFFLVSIVGINGSRILAAYVFSGKSHFMMNSALVRELIRRGHEVTFITSFSMKNEHLGANYTEILIEPPYEFWNDVRELLNLNDLFEFTNLSNFEFLDMVELIGLKTAEHALNQTKVQNIINSKVTNNVYELFLAEQFFQEAFLAFAYKFNIPVITSSTLDYSLYMSQMMGIISPWSYVPHGFFPYDDHMTFIQRFTNSFHAFYEDIRRETSYFPKQDELVKKYFSRSLINIPKVSKMEKNISAILVNSYAPLTTARPTAPGMIPIGGIHIYPPKLLPNDIKNFLDEAENGAIYFSLGSNVRSADMPPAKIQIFLEVFATLKQRVLWKFEDSNILKLPANVMIKHWMPQSDILAHPNIKIFITHGGLFGTQEGVHYAIPMLGMPVYCDQHLNMNKAAKAGYAINLHFQKISKDILSSALSELLNNPFYKNNAQRVSKIFRDRPLDAKDTAIYWIEYVIRHKGALHMRVAGVDLPWYKFYLLDVIALGVALVMGSLLILYFGLRKLVSKILSPGAKIKHN